MDDSSNSACVPLIQRTRSDDRLLLPYSSVTRNHSSHDKSSSSRADSNGNAQVDRRIRRRRLPDAASRRVWNPARIDEIGRRGRKGQGEETGRRGEGASGRDACCTEGASGLFVEWVANGLARSRSSFACRRRKYGEQFRILRVDAKLTMEDRLEFLPLRPRRLRLDRR